MYKLVKQTQDLTEYQHCIAFIEWCQYNPITRDYLFHIPNGGKREVKTYTNRFGKTVSYCPEGRRLKLMGVKAGVSDYFLAYPHKGYHGAFLEAKPKFSGKPSKEQSEWMTKMTTQGYYAKVCLGTEGLIKAVLDYLGDDNLDLIS